MRLEIQGTVKELRAQLEALGRAHSRRGAYRAAASVGSVACLAGAYLWRVYDLAAAGPVKIALAVLLLGCTAVLVWLSRADLDSDKLILLSKLLGVLRPAMKGHGTLSVGADLGSSTQQDPGNWLTLQFSLGRAQVQIDARGQDSAVFTFRCDDTVQVSALKTAVDGSPVLGDCDSEIQDGALRTALREPGEGAAARLVRAVEGYVAALQASVVSAKSPPSG